MKHALILSILVACLAACQKEPKTEQTNVVTTFCNPVDLSYRFCVDRPSRREAADPTILWFKDRYFLFASKSGGYWHSKDLHDWTFIETNEIPVEEYAPTAIAFGDTLFFLASSNEKSTVYKSHNPLSGHWNVARENLDKPVWDPAFFLDDDGKLYLYWGCSNVNPLYGVEVDYKNNFAFIGEPAILLQAHTDKYGWEVPGDYNTLKTQAPWIEGAWMNKHNGKYYLQYSGPGTEYKSYTDGIYTAEKPLGPFTVQPHNPFVYKPEGFANGAGHGSTFTDTYGNLWHIGTITISQKHMFERRLGLYPAFFSEQGTLYGITKYGDYPMILPTKKINGFNDLFAGWMLLSYNKTVTVSSAIDSLPATRLADEDIRTYWAAQSGSAEEYASIDLRDTYDVYAIQINFAEHNTKILGRQKNIAHRYTLEYSTDGTQWTLIDDKSKNDTDNTHVYTQLAEKVVCRYLRIKNIQVPDGNFAISDFRVFGKGHGPLPGKIDGFDAKRNTSDRKRVTITWQKAEHATGYVISFGLTEDALHHSYRIYGDTTSVTINTLNTDQRYAFSIEAFNENGITANNTIKVQE